MLHQTKRIKNFVLEIYELTHWNYNTKGYRLSFSYEYQSFRLVEQEHWNVKPDCYKKIVVKKFNSERKLNQYLKEKGFIKKRYGAYWFEPNLEKSIRGYYGNKGKSLGAPDYVTVVRKLHDLDAVYTFRP